VLSLLLLLSLYVLCSGFGFLLIFSCWFKEDTKQRGGLDEKDSFSLLFSTKKTKIRRSRRRRRRRRRNRRQKERKLRA